MQGFDKSYTDLERVCRDFESAQQAQLRAMEAGNFKDVMSLNDRRVEVFCRLKECLDKFAIESSGPADTDFLGELQEKIGRLLAGEKVLDVAAVECQEMLLDKLGDLRKGKTALKGYSVRHGNAPDARFTSNMG